MTPVLDYGRYWGLCLSKKGKPKRFLVHRLVAFAFVPPRPGTTDVNHIDGNPKNNRAENLEHCTRSENIRHAFAMGLNYNNSTKGEASTSSKLTEAKIEMIIRRRAAGETYRVIAKDIGVATSTACAAVTGQNWKHIKCTSLKSPL